MNQAVSQHKKDKELVEAGVAFLTKFAQAAINQDDLARVPPESGLHFGAGGIVEVTQDVSDALAKFVSRAAKLLGSAAAHERAISDIALSHAQTYLAQHPDVDAATSALIEQIFSEGNATYQYAAPNRLVRFSDNVRDVAVGPVRAMQTADLIAGRKEQYPSNKLDISIAHQFSLEIGGGTARISMPAICWLVTVDAVAENVEEEGKWLIDVAVSLLRLCHSRWHGRFPTVGSVEPHPVRGRQLQNEGVKFRDASALAGGGEVPAWYEIDKSVVATATDEKFVSNASLIFAPAKKSISERVSQALGWLTRARQAEDRAERFLYFFTAIEALLSSDDKTAPIVQTIARHGAVLLTNDNAERMKIASQIKKLYTFRSALVHAGNRSILWSATNEAQMLAEAMLTSVLDKADLKGRHADFCLALADASYGLPWPAQGQAKQTGFGGR